MFQNITADDVSVIYNKIEASKKGSFYIDSSNKEVKKIMIENHIEKGVADFFSSKNSDSKTKKEALEHDSKLAGRLIEGLV